jgi:hypothetical protein
MSVKNRLAKLEERAAKAQAGEPPLCLLFENDPDYEAKLQAIRDYYGNDKVVIILPAKDHQRGRPHPPCYSGQQCQ